MPPLAFHNKSCRRRRRPWWLIVTIPHVGVWLRVVLNQMEGKFRTMESMHKTLGIIVAFTIGFKNKTAYDRFWEVRFRCIRY